MIYIGFGFLYTFLRAHSWTSVALNWISGAWSMLCAMLWIGFWYRVYHAAFTDNKITIDVRRMIDGDFCAGSSLIALGVVLGKVNIMQTLFFSTVLPCIYSCNYQLIATVYGIADIGGSIVIHSFGAVFGLSMSRAYLTPKHSQ